MYQTNQGDIVSYIWSMVSRVRMLYQLPWYISRFHSDDFNEFKTDRYLALSAVFTNFKNRSIPLISSSL